MWPQDQVPQFVDGADYDRALSIVEMTHRFTSEFDSILERDTARKDAIFKVE
jgi:hypothetical protein